MIIMVFLQLGLMYSLFNWFRELSEWIDVILTILSVAIVLSIIKNSRHLSSDIIWIIGIMIFPIAGTITYLFLGADLLSSKTFRSIKKYTKEAKKYYVQDEQVLKELDNEGKPYKGQFNYISKYAGYPFYKNEDFTYYELGDLGYPVMIEELKKAENFIFLEYFIIKEGKMWDGILEVLKDKAKQGLDVRVMYDDLGSFTTLSFSYAKELEKMGIKCEPFNRINPIIGAIMNHRDHRKILVIDGKVAFSGGINLADEYINLKHRFGHWKDNVFRVKGEAVWTYTVMFLTHWNALRQEDDDFLKFKVQQENNKFDGYIAPYGETPLDDELTAQYIYTNILNQANDYCYIYTPYLIIDTDLINVLRLAAKRGVDVKIITPGIPDKKIVFNVTRSYYKALIEAGVEIYEYSPGFVHSKLFVADDIVAAVGTINLDFRSLYHHFENGTYLYKSEKVLDMKKDITDALKVSHKLSIEEVSYGFFKGLLLSLLRLFAPLL